MKIISYLLSLSLMFSFVLNADESLYDSKDVSEKATEDVVEEKEGVEDLVSNEVNLIEQPKHLDNQVLLLNLLYML